MPVTSEAVYDAVSVKYTKPSDGIPADDLADDVHLIPSGGTIGQVLRKISNNDWDIEWNTINDGEDGSGVWYTTARISGGENPFVRRRSLIGREGATVQVHDLLFAPDVGHDGEPTTLYEITSVSIACLLNRLCKMQGEPGEDGVGVPSGGTIGQILKKKSGTDYDTEWANESGCAFIVTVTYSDDAYSADKTFTQIESALQAGMEVSVVYESLWYKLIFITESPSFALFSRINGTETDTFYLDDQGSVSRTVTTLGTYSKPNGGIPASDLANDVHLIPAGGTIGQVLRKISNNDWDIDWSDFNGCAVWWTNRIFIASTETEISYTVRQIDLHGSTGTPSVNDYVFGPVTGLGEIDSLFQISSDIIGGRYDLTPITTFHGTSDYDSLTNKPSINNVELSGDKSLSDLGIESKPMLVTLSWTGSGDIYTADKTYAEITNAMAAGQEVLVDWGASILRPSEPGFTWIGYDDGQILEFILHEDSSWIGIITDFGSYRTAADQDVIDRQQNTAIAAKYTKPAGGIPASDLAAGVIPTIPTNVSSFTNDAGYLTLSDLPIYDGGVS